MYDTDSECGNAAPLTLHYGNHHVYLMAEIQQSGDEHSDMELMCEQGATIRAHSLVLASVSPLVRRLLKEDNVCMYHNLVLQFPEIKEVHMKTVLDFIYTGQASVLVSVVARSFVVVPVSGKTRIIAPFRRKTNSTRWSAC